MIVLTGKRDSKSQDGEDVDVLRSSVLYLKLLCAFEIKLLSNLKKSMQRSIAKNWRLSCEWLL